MDKKSKQRRQKSATPDELKEMTPPGASFDTEQGRAAQGMRPDIGVGDQPSAFDEDDDDESEDDPEEPARKADPDAAAGQSSA